MCKHPAFFLIACAQADLLATQADLNQKPSCSLNRTCGVCRRRVNGEGLMGGYGCRSPGLIAASCASAVMCTAYPTTPAGGSDLMAWSAGQVYSALTSESGVDVETGIAYGSNARHRLDIYRASSADAKAPVVIFYYGGSWRAGDRATYGFVGTALAKRGITTVIPDYRLFPEVQFPGFVDDAAQAYAWVSTNTARLGAARAGARPVVVAGHSAGAHTAALLTLDASYLNRHAPGMSPPCAFIGLAGPYAFDPTTSGTTKDVFASARRNPDSARPVAYVASAKAPPTLLLHGSDDTTVKVSNTRDLGAGINAAGQKARVIEYTGIGHIGLILSVSKPLRWRAPVLDDIVAFVAQQSAGVCEPSSATRAR
jgi:acetyl esterase/lipase